MKEIVFSPLMKISSVYRYPGMHLAKPESVGDHIAQVGIMAMLTGNRLNNILRDAYKSEYDSGQLNLVDTGLLAQRALAHDLDEYKTTDIRRDVKYYNPTIHSELEKLGDSVVSSVSEKYEYPDLYDLWKNAKDATVEGQIIKLCDLLSVVYKVAEEVVVLGNKTLVITAIELQDHLQSLKTKWSEDTMYLPEVREFMIDMISTGLETSKSIVKSYKSEIADFVSLDKL